MYKIFKIKKLIFFNLLLVIFNFVIPSNFTEKFNGLPISGEFDLIFLFIFFPIILLMPKFIESYFIRILILLITIIKIFLIFSPENGISHKIYFIGDKDKNYIKTYNSFWNSEYSSIQKFDWTKKENFPIDWLPNTDKVLNSSDPYYYYSKDDFKKINLGFNSEFILFLKSDSKLDLNLNNGEIKKIKINNLKSNKIYIYENEEIYLDSGKYLIKIEYILKGNNYRFNPFITNKNQPNKNISILKNNLAFIPGENINNINHKIFLTIGKLYDYLIIIISIFIILKLLIYYKKNLGILFNVSFIFFTTYLFNLLISFFINNEKFLLYKLNFSFSLSIFLFLLLYLVAKFKILKKINFISKSKIENNLNYFLCFIFPLIIIGILRNYSEIGALTWWVPGDDGHTYQKFAREILVGGEWLHPNTIYRQAPMYIYALFHIIFGQSGFPQKIIEYYLVGLICFFTFKIILDLTKSKNLSIIFSLILLVIFTGEKYTTFIGKGYTEFYAAFLIIFTVYLLRKIKLNFYFFIILFLFSIFGLGLREDHIFAIFAIIFYSISIKSNIKKNFYNDLFTIIRNNFSKLFFYGILILLSYLLIFIRNYFAYEDMIERLITNQNLQKIFGIFNHPSMASKNNIPSAYLSENIYYSYYRMFFGSIPFQLPRPTTIILLPGFLLTLFALIRPEKFNYINIGSIMTIIGILFPYLLIVNHGYEPRFTIHYLPFCIIILSEFISYQLKKNSKTIL